MTTTSGLSLCIVICFFPLAIFGPLEGWWLATALYAAACVIAAWTWVCPSNAPASNGQRLVRWVRRS